MSAFNTIAAHVQARSGLHLGPEKHYLMRERLAPLLEHERMRDMDALALELQLNRRESLSRAVVEAMTTNESLFFRDGAPFRHAGEALRRMHQTLPPGRPLRVWSAACSTGQEAYSVAMTAYDIPGLVDQRGLEILGTDIASATVERARSGLFTPFEVKRGLPGPMLARWFDRDGEGWRVAARLRALCTFREWNLVAPLAPLGLFDLVLCRNVLIYFDPPTKQKVLAAIKRQMNAHATLYVGAGETMLGLDCGLVPDPGCMGAYVPR